MQDHKVVKVESDNENEKSKDDVVYHPKNVAPEITFADDELQQIKVLRKWKRRS